MALRAADRCPAWWPWMLGACAAYAVVSLAMAPLAAVMLTPMLGIVTCRLIPSRALVISLLGLLALLFSWGAWHLDRAPECQPYDCPSVTLEP